jgi:hypothetical protein
MPRTTIGKLHLPPRWVFAEKGLTGEKAYHGEFTLWALAIPLASGDSWSAGLSLAGGQIVRVAGVPSRAKAIAAVEAAAVAGGWMLPRERKGVRRGTSNA